MLDIRYELAENRKEKPDFNKLGFGRYFTDHMFIMDYTEGKGWHDARIVPYGPLTLDPACMVFHYAQEMFEGLKACMHKSAGEPRRCDSYIKPVISGRSSVVPFL